MKAYIIPYKGELFQETRKSYFLKAFGEEIRDMRIIPFGKCNYSCPYCKRNGYDKQDNIIAGSIEVDEQEIWNAINDAIIKKQIIRLSGGDPCMYPDLSIKILKHVKKQNGIGSLAHNGSSPIFIKYLLDHYLLDSLSVDLKAPNAEKLKGIAGLSEKNSHLMWKQTLQTLEILKHTKDVKIDIRTCVFHHTCYEELLKIGKIVQDTNIPNAFWTLRIYSIVESFSKKTKTAENLKELAKMLSKELPNLKIGIRVKWINGAFFYYLNGNEIDNVF